MCLGALPVAGRLHRFSRRSPTHRAPPSSPSARQHASTPAALAAPSPTRPGPSSAAPLPRCLHQVARLCPPPCPGTAPNPQPTAHARPRFSLSGAPAATATRPPRCTTAAAHQPPTRCSRRTPRPRRRPHSTSTSAHSCAVVSCCRCGGARACPEPLFPPSRVAADTPCLATATIGFASTPALLFRTAARVALAKLPPAPPVRSYALDPACRACMRPTAGWFNSHPA